MNAWFVQAFAAWLSAQLDWRCSKTSSIQSRRFREISQ